MQYRCSICGYVYNEDKESVPFADLPEDWKCPWCGAPKALFEPVGAAPPVQAEPEPAPAPEPPADVPDVSMTKLSVGQMAALCSNLARGCEKQYMPAEMALFNELADWFTRRVPPVEDATVEAVAAQLKQDIADYADVRKTGEDQADRGAQRVCVWGEKVTRILQSLVGRYLRDGDALLEDTEIWVCSVCGFVYIGQDAPELCPVCKVPSWKFNKVDRRKQS